MPRSQPKPPTNTFDGPWKAALECYLRPALQLCFPKVHRLVDWRVAPVFLDKELQQLATDLPSGVITADKLVKVRWRNGAMRHLYIHVEVQAQKDRTFARRMWTYHYRVYDRVRQPLISLAVLADPARGWRPCEYHE